MVSSLSIWFPEQDERREVLTDSCPFLWIQRRFNLGKDRPSYSAPGKSGGVNPPQVRCEATAGKGSVPPWSDGIGISKELRNQDSGSRRQFRSVTVFQFFDHSLEISNPRRRMT